MERGVDVCQRCGAGDLFDTETEPGHEGTSVTVCQTCGLIQKSTAKAKCVFCKKMGEVAGYHASGPVGICCWDERLRTTS